MTSVPPRAIAAAAGQNSGMAPIASNNRLSATEEGRSGWSDDPTRCQVPPTGINAGSLSKQKSPVRPDVSTPKEAVLSSSTFLGRSGVSSRRPAVSSSRDLQSSEAEPSRSRAPDVSPGTFQRNSAPRRTSQTPDYSDPRHKSNSNNYESTIRGIRGLNFDANDRIHY